MHFLNLPNELLCLIASFFNFGYDINSLAKVNTHLYLLLNPILYQHNARYSYNSALLWAAEYGNEATARKAQKGGASLNCAYYGRKPITLAAADGHDALVRLFLEQGVNLDPDPDDLEEYYPPPHPLGLAAMNGHESVVKLLLAHGATADDAVMGRDQTPLSVAAEEGHLDIVKLFAQAKCDMQSRDCFGWTPLAHAASNGHVDVVRFLLDHQVDQDIQDNVGDTAIFCAAKKGHLEVVKLLLDNGADPESKMPAGVVLYPLAWGGQDQHHAVVKLLLSSIDLETRIRYGSPDEHAALLSGAASCGWGDLVQRLLEHGCPADAKISNNRNPLRHLNLPSLSIATERGHHHIVEQLLRYNADPNPQSAMPFLPIMLAVSKGNVRILQSLLDYGADPNTRDEYLTPILFNAIPFESIFELLLDRGADPYTKTNHGVDIFERTLSSGNPQLVGILLARRNILDWKDMGRFQSAIIRGGEVMVRFAMNAVVDGKEARTNMYEAASYGDAGLVKFFLDQGVRPQPTPNASLALEAAASRKPPKATAEIAGLLLDHGADVDSLFIFSWKLLFKSINKNESAIQFLLERGADPFPRDWGNSDSPLAHAAREGSVNVVKYLLDAIDRRNIPVDDIRGELFSAKSKAADFYTGSEGECRDYLFIERLIEHYYWRRKYPCT